MYKNIKEYILDFKADEIVKAYLNALTPEMRRTVKGILRDPANNAYLHLQMKAMLARILYRNEGYYTISSMRDNMVQQALKVLHSDIYSKVVRG